MPRRKPATNHDRTAEERAKSIQEQVLEALRGNLVENLNEQLGRLQAESEEQPLLQRALLIASVASGMVSDLRGYFIRDEEIAGLLLEMRKRMDLLREM